jgi:hypothetical protein
MQHRQSLDEETISREQKSLRHDHFSGAWRWAVPCEITARHFEKALFLKDLVQARDVRLSSACAIGRE